MQKELSTTIIEQLTIKYSNRFRKVYVDLKDLNIFDFDENDVRYHQTCSEYVKGMVDWEKHNTEFPNFEKMFSYYSSKIPEDKKDIKEFLLKK